jgi:hypothetical protein
VRSSSLISGASTTTNSSYFQPALIGGLVLGVLSALPIVAFGNVCCCLWVVSGGAVSAYALQQRQTTPVTPGEGALLGLLAGLIGTFVYLMLSVPISLLMAPLEQRVVERLTTLGNLPPEFRDYANRPAGLRMVGVLLDFLIRLFVNAIFSTIGGVLGAIMFVKKTSGVVDLRPE